MDFIEVTIHCVSEAVEDITAMLLDFGITGMQIEDDLEFQNFLNSNSWDYVEEELLKAHGTENKAKIKIYLQDNEYGLETMLAVKGGLNVLKTNGYTAGSDVLCMETVNVNDQQWINNWKKYYKPFSIGKKIIIKPMWENYENDDEKIVLNINPGHIFGTGQHQTTQMCIEALENHITPHTNVLDLGCGSGILSVAALLLKADNVFAVDIDPNAIKVVYENAGLNGFNQECCFVTAGDIITDKTLRNKIGERKYNVVVANIVADVIIQMSPLVPDFLIERGLFITSGIIDERLEDVVNVLEANGFDIMETAKKDGWVCIVSQKGEGVVNA